MEIFKSTNFDFLGKKWAFIGLSLVLTAAGLVSLIAKGGPDWGLDFKGGALIDLRFSHKPATDRIRQVLAQSIKGEVSVQEVTTGGGNDVQIGLEAQNALQLEAARTEIASAAKSSRSSGRPAKAKSPSTPTSTSSPGRRWSHSPS